MGCSMHRRAIVNNIRCLLRMVLVLNTLFASLSPLHDEDNSEGSSHRNFTCMRFENSSVYSRARHPKPKPDTHSGASKVGNIMAHRPQKEPEGYAILDTFGVQARVTERAAVRIFRTWKHRIHATGHASSD